MAELQRITPQVILSRGPWSGRRTPLSSDQVLYFKIGAILPFETSLSGDEWEALAVQLLSGEINVPDARNLLAKMVPALRLELRIKALRCYLLDNPLPSRCADLRRILEGVCCSRRDESGPQADTTIGDGKNLSFLCSSLLMLSISIDRQEKLNILSRVSNGRFCCQQVSELAEILIDEYRYFTDMCQNSGEQIDALRKTAEQGLVEVVLPWLLQSRQFSPGPPPMAKRPSGPHFIFEVEGDPS